MRSRAAFLSYVQMDDKHEEGRLTDIRRKLEAEVKLQTGESFTIFQDRKDILIGQRWRNEIREGIDGSTLLVAIVTPSYLKSDNCRKELNRFLELEAALGRDDLILPVLYVATPALDDTEDDPLAAQLESRHWFDWLELRFADLSSEVSRRAIAELASGIESALQRSKQEPTQVDAVSLASVDAETDDVAGPGFVELVAEAEDAMPEFIDTMSLFTETLEDHAQLAVHATSRIEATESSSKPAKARLEVLRQLATGLEEPTARMEELAVDYVDQLARCERRHRGAGLPDSDSG